MKHKRSTEAIVEMAKKKSNETREKVEKTISRLVLEGELINFNVVSKEAGISKSWLYSNQDIRARIENLRDNKNSTKTRKKDLTIRSQASKDILVTTLKNRIKELENENKKLHKQLEVLYGEMYNN